MKTNIVSLSTVLLLFICTLFFFPGCNKSGEIAAINKGAISSVKSAKADTPVTPPVQYITVPLWRRDYLFAANCFSRCSGGTPVRYASAGGTIIPAKIGATTFNCCAYACVKADNSYSVTLINREETNNITFNIQLSVTASSIQIARLSAPSITSTENVTFPGSATNANGTFTPAAAPPQTVNQNDLSVNIPAGSAAVVTIR